MSDVSDPLDILVRLTGHRVVAIEQAFYVVADVVDPSDCLLQMRLDDDLTVHLWVGEDGASVRVVAAPWEDPFRELLSAENRTFVQESGKWTLFDTSATPEMAPVVGCVVQRIFTCTRSGWHDARCSLRLGC